MIENNKAPGPVWRGGPQTLNYPPIIIHQQGGRTKQHRDKALGIFRKRIDTRIKVAQEVGSPMLQALLRFRATQLRQWQTGTGPNRTGERHDG